MLGGLVTTTLLSLFVLPALYLRFGAGAQPEVEFQIDPIRRWDAVEGEPVHGNREAAAEPDGPRGYESVSEERHAEAAHREQPAGADSTPPTEDGDSASPGRRGE
jgi:hypothetical protein